jgi:hypothetical protein
MVKKCVHCGGILQRTKYNDGQDNAYCPNCGWCGIVACGIPADCGRTSNIENNNWVISNELLEQVVKFLAVARDIMPMDFAWNAVDDIEGLWGDLWTAFKDGQGDAPTALALWLGDLPARLRKFREEWGDQIKELIKGLKFGTKVYERMLDKFDEAFAPELQASESVEAGPQ